VIPLFHDIVRRFRRQQLLNWAAVLSYNALWTVPPLTLLLLALAGFFDLKAAWRDHVGPDVRKHVTPETWRAVDSTVNRILGSPHVVWVVIGFLLAVWHLSALVRASSGALNAILERRERRAGWARIAQSAAVAVPMLLLISLALLVVVGGRLIPVHGFAAAAALFVARWGAAAVVMWAALALVIRTAPAAAPGAKWVSEGAALAVGGWIAASIVFGIYVGYVADFKSPYGNLISVMVLLAYLYWLSLAFLAGVLVDVVLAERRKR
jgi:membrane protein